MKVTVGIPTYNRSDMLKQSIASVLAQSFTGFRLLVSDNASDDDTPDVVRSFGDARIDYDAPSATSARPRTTAHP